MMMSVCGRREAAGAQAGAIIQIVSALKRISLLKAINYWRTKQCQNRARLVAEVVCAN